MLCHIYHGKTTLNKEENAKEEEKYKTIQILTKYTVT